MVASISARGNASTAARYYLHLKEEPYYLTDQDTESFWLGAGCGALGLRGQVTNGQFSRLLQGLHPRNQSKLVNSGGRKNTRQSGWDLTLSAPKSVSIVWALSDTLQRSKIERVQKAAAKKTVQWAESNLALCRRGKGGRNRENAAGLVFAAFQHFTSRKNDPQLHLHLFTFNAAQRQDLSWGAILSKPLYQAQKQLGSIYRAELNRGLLKLGYAASEAGETIKIKAISDEMEQAFSTRRNDIKKLVEQIANPTARDYEKATLKSRPKKQSISLDVLLKTWRQHAQSLGLNRECIAPKHIEAPSRKNVLAKFRASVSTLRSFSLSRRPPALLSININRVKKICIDWIAYRFSMKRKSGQTLERIHVTQDPQIKP